MDRIRKNADGAHGIVLADARADRDVVPDSQLSDVWP
jgi:hypothetical protein